MQIHKKLKVFIGLVCTVALLFSALTFSVAAVDGKSVTATTTETVKQGGSYTCYVYIDSSESLAALDVTVHFDPTKVKVNNVYNSISCVLYDNVKNTDNIQFNYILDGKGSSSKTRLFYFTYQVLSNAEVGDAYFDITIGEAYDKQLNDVVVSGYRLKFSITETVTTKTCTVSSNSTVSTSVGDEFSLSYRFSTYQIASGSAAILYDPELFEVVEATSGTFLSNKLYDINTELKGTIYVSFVGTTYNTKYDFVTVKFRTIKNVEETSKITFKATELCDKDLNVISCKEYTTTANIMFDNSFVGDAPKMSVVAEYNETAQKVTAKVLLEANSNLGAGDFVIEFNPEVLVLSSYEQGFSPNFFNINDKEIADGKLKFSIISLEDITSAEKVITLSFDVANSCTTKETNLSIKGSFISDSMTKPIKLNFINDSLIIPEQHIYDDDYDADCNKCGETRDIPEKVVIGDIEIELTPNDELPIDEHIATKYILGWKNPDGTKYEGTTYVSGLIAEFVETQMMHVKYQLSSDVTMDSEKTSVRFIASVDQTERYQKVGWLFSLTDSTPTLGEEGVSSRESTVVYKSIKANGKILSASDIYGTDYSEYLYLFEIRNIPNTAFGKSIYSRAYVVMEDGRIIYGDYSEINIEEVISRNSSGKNTSTGTDIDE